jgi:hypothetical protein
MRKVLADCVTRASMLIGRPDGLDRVIKFSEPNSSNIGRTGIQGVEEEGGFVQSIQNLLLEIKTSGDTFSKALRNTNRARPGRFLFKSDALYDRRAAGGAVLITDADNYMGREAARIGHYVSPFPHSDHDSELPLQSITVKPLKHWKRNARNSSIENYETVMAMAMCVENIGGGSALIKAYHMMINDSDTEGASPSYIWQEFNGNGDAHLYDDFNNSDIMLFSYSANPPKIDFCELPDGSWFVVVVFDDTMQIYRTTDYGATFETVFYDTSITGVNRDWSVACEYFNGRIVVVYSNSANTEIKLKYSDDFGSTWEDGDDISAVLGYHCVRLHTRRDFPGALYITGDAGASVHALFSYDGLTWIDGVDLTTDNYSTHGIAEESNGRKLLYGINAGKLEMRYNESGGISISYESTVYYGSPASYSVWEIDDTDGMDYLECDAIDLNNAGFVDVVYITEDDHGGSTYYSIGVVRCKMWCGIQGDTLWETAWHPSFYPSTSDAHPNVNHWTQFQSGAGASVIYDSGFFSNLTLTTDVAAEDIYYQRGLAADAWDNGCVIKFEARVGSGEIRVAILLEQVGSVKMSYVVIRFTETQVIIYDVNAAAAVATATPTNWNPTDRNEYYIVAKEDEIYIYRAPSGIYREAVPYELVTSFAALTNDDPGGVDNSGFWWGLGDPVGPEQPISTAYVYSVSVRDGNAAGLDWDFFEDSFGHPCSNEPIGLLQGVCAKYNGPHVTKDDKWELDTGAIHEADNVFSPSPSRKWKEPSQTAGDASPERVFEWRRPLDASSNEMDFVFDGLAVFGRNWQGCKLEGMNYDGSGAVDLFDSYDGGSEEDWLVKWEAYAAGVQDNTVRVYPIVASPSSFEPMIPDQFKSDGHQNWYMRPTTGTAADVTFRILGNTENRLILDMNVEEANLAAGDQFVIFSSSFLFLTDDQKRYERLKLTINAQERAVDELSMEVGTIVIGRVYDLPADAWGYSFTREENNIVVAARSGFEEHRRIGPIRRTVNLTYTGLEDQGMAVTTPSELYRATRGGIDPIVWIDDDSALVTDANKCHHNPLLARMVGNNHTHRAYIYRNESEDAGLNLGYVVRGIHDASGISLREIL